MIFLSPFTELSYHCYSKLHLYSLHWHKGYLLWRKLTLDTSIRLFIGIFHICINGVDFIIVGITVKTKKINGIPREVMVEVVHRHPDWFLLLCCLWISEMVNIVCLTLWFIYWFLVRFFSLLTFSLISNIWLVLDTDFLLQMVIDRPI